LGATRVGLRLKENRLVLNVKDLSLSMGANRNLTLPEYPALISDLIQIRESERSLMVFGTNSPRLLEGKSIASVTAKLFPLLDGRRHRDVICRSIPSYSPATTLDALYFLYAEGLLIEGGNAPATPPSTKASNYFDRYVSIKRNRGNGRQVCGLLARTRVGVIAAQEQCTAIAEILEAAGLIDIQVLSPDRFLCGAPDSSLSASGAVAASQFDLLVLAPLDLTERQTGDLARHLRQCGVPVLPVDAVRMSIGPLVSGMTIACPMCLFSQCRDGTETPEFGAIEREYALALLACRIGFYLGDLVDLPMEDNVIRFCDQSLSLQSYAVHRLPDCILCSPRASIDRSSISAAGTRAGTAVRFVEFFHFNTQERATPAARSAHFSSYSSDVRRAVSGAFKAYPRCETTQLSHRVSGQSAASTSWPGRVHKLIDVLTAWSGKLGDGTNEMAVRATPSAGNLSSQNLYLVTDAHVGVQAGIYYCHPDGALRRICTGNYVGDIDASCAELPERIGHARAYLIATATLARLESKYRDKAYRFAFQDAGALIANILVLAPELGLDLRLCSNFLDDRIAALLRICSAGEIVTSAIQLGFDPLFPSSGAAT
jgi:SagB-type dehydrogenase family enzyme